MRKAALGFLGVVVAAGLAVGIVAVQPFGGHTAEAVQPGPRATVEDVGGVEGPEGLLPSLYPRPRQSLHRRLIERPRRPESPVVGSQTASSA